MDSLSKREKPKARKKLKNAAHTHRQVHTVLGGLLLWDMAIEVYSLAEQGDHAHEFVTAV